MRTIGFLDKEEYVGDGEPIDYHSYHNGFEDEIGRGWDMEWVTEGEIGYIKKILCRADSDDYSRLWHCKIYRKNAPDKYWAGNQIEISNELIEEFKVGQSTGGDYHSFEVKCKEPYHTKCQAITEVKHNEWYNKGMICTKGTVPFTMEEVFKE